MPAIHYPGTPGSALYFGRPSAPIIVEPDPDTPWPTVANELLVSLPTGSATDYPLQFGRAFPLGAVADTPEVLLGGTPLAAQQADVKTRHTDGSVKFAVISVVIPSLGTTEQTLVIGNKAAPTAPTAEIIANMLASYDFEATIGIAVGGTPVAGAPVSARAMFAALTDSALAAETTAGGVNSRYWTVGPVCTTVLLCDHTTKAWDVGTNATKAIRPMFHVQFWPGIGKYHVRHIIEIADVTKVKDELGLDITFTTGNAAPVTRLSQTTGLWNGQFQTRAYWGGTDVPRLNIKHGVEYMASTGALPNHDPRPISAAVLASYESDWASRSKALGAQGYYNKAMAATGGRPELGLMQKWDTLALVSGTATMHDIAEKHAEFFGSFNFFWREGDARNIIGSTVGTGRILSKLFRPTQFWDQLNAGSTALADRFVIDGVITGAPNGFAKDGAHTPGAFWFSYLTTGAAIWHEKMLQLGAWSQYIVNPGLSFNSVGNGRANTDLILNGLQPRAFGWQFRNRARAWWASLDGSAEKALCDRMCEDALAQQAGLHDLPDYFIGHPVRAAWNTNYAAWYGAVVTAGRPNALQFFGGIGATVASNPPDALRQAALWMQNYTAMSVSHSVQLGRADAVTFANWTSDLAIRIVLSARPRTVAIYEYPQLKTDGTYFQSLEDIFDGWSNDGQQVEPTSMPLSSAAGFGPTAGTPNTYGVTAESYALIASTTVAMANTHPDQGAAWAVLKPWFDNCAWFDHDARYSVKPKE